MSVSGKRETELREAHRPGPAGPDSQPTLDYLTCEICGQRMSERQCKIVCANCGYTRDCSDP